MGAGLGYLRNRKLSDAFARIHAFHALTAHGPVQLVVGITGRAPGCVARPAVRRAGFAGVVARSAVRPSGAGRCRDAVVSISWWQVARGNAWERCFYRPVLPARRVVPLCLLWGAYICCQDRSDPASGGRRSDAMARVIYLSIRRGRDQTAHRTRCHSDRSRHRRMCIQLRCTPSSWKSKVCSWRPQQGCTSVQGRQLCSRGRL